MEDDQRSDTDETADRFDGSYYIVGDAPNKNLSMTFTCRPLLHTYLRGCECPNSILPSLINLLQSTRDCL
jgi:hypothetical protein